MSKLTMHARATQKALGLALVSLNLAAANGAFAADVLDSGIPVYQGARPDAAATDFVRTSLGMEGAAYRTADALVKVAGFYSKQAGMKPMGEPTKDTAAFLAGCKDEYNEILKKNMSRCGYHVTLQNPWMDMKTGKMVNDTLITIVKQE